MTEWSWSDRLSWARDRAIHEALRLLPTPVVSAAGARLGDLSMAVGKASRLQRAAAALAHLRPDLDEPARLALARENLRNAGRTMAEFSCLHRFAREGRIDEEGWENVPGPAVVAMLHIGNWEAGMVTVREAGRQVRSIYQPPANAARLAIAKQVRRDLGNDAIPGSPMAMRESLRTLARGDSLLAIFVDEFVGGRVGAPAFGRPPARGGNVSLAPRLARRAGVPLVVAYCERRPGPRFVMRCLPPVPLTGDEAGDQAALDAVIEPVVRAHLDQWLMLYAFRPDR